MLPSKIIMDHFLVLELVFVILLKEMEAREIILSKNATSIDNENCGSINSPCKTVDYAIELTKDGDILSIEYGHYFIIQPIAIKHSITIQKWDSYRRPIIIAPGIPNHLYFHVHSNISIFEVDFYTDLVIDNSAWLHLIAKKKFISVRNCLFHAINIFATNESLLSDQETIAMDLINITNYHYTYLLHGDKIKIEPRGTPKNCSIIISKNKCMITNTVMDGPLITFQGKELRLENSYINGGAVTTCCNTSILNTTFKNSILNYKGVSNNYKFSLNEVIKLTISKCTFDNTPVLLTNIDSSDIRDSTFKTMENSTDGALTLSNNVPIYEFTIIRCTFNTSIFPQNMLMPVVSFSGKRLMDTVSLIDTSFIGIIKDTKILHSDVGSLLLKNVSVFCGAGQFNKQSGIRKGFDDMIDIRCISCRKGYYNLRGEHSIMQKGYRSDIIPKNIHNKSKQCYTCPPNGICEGGKIRSKGEYWGYIETLDTIAFLPCPIHYCCLTSEQCMSYNTCNKHREGILCSDCEVGFSCSINSNYQCVRNKECDNGTVGFIILCVLSLFLVASMLFMKEIIIFIKQVMKFQNQNSMAVLPNEQCSELQERLIHMPSYITDDPVPYQELSLETNHVNEENYRKSSTLASGCVKIIFFFYQTASTIRIQSPGKLDIKCPYFLDILFSVFNLRIDISYSKLQLCFLPSLGVMHTEILKSSVIWIAFVFLIFIWILVKCYRWMLDQKDCKNIIDTTKFSVINDNVPSYSKMPLLTRVKCTYLLFLLISFAGIASFCFNAIFCVHISNSLYLYQQASIKCYQTWQYFIVAVVALWIIPFFGALYGASKLLHRCQITPNQFLASLTFPPIIIPLAANLFIHPVKTLNKSEAMNAKHLLLVINEPFKESGDGSRLCWESILILRRMLLIIMKTFIIYPISKLYPMTILLIIFIFHYVFVEPYSDQRLNKLEFVSLNILLTLVFANMFWAVTQEYNLLASPSYNMLGKILLYYEMFILALPIVILVLGFLGFLFKKCFTLYKYLKTKFLHKQD